MTAIQIFLALIGCCGAGFVYIWQKFKWLIADFDAGMKHAMQCAFCDLKIGSSRGT